MSQSGCLLQNFALHHMSLTASCGFPPVDDQEVCCAVELPRAPKVRCRLCKLAGGVAKTCKSGTMANPRANQAEDNRGSCAAGCAGKQLIRLLFSSGGAKAGGWGPDGFRIQVKACADAGTIRCDFGSVGVLGGAAGRNPREFFSGTLARSETSGQKKSVKRSSEWRLVVRTLGHWRRDYITGASRSP